MRTSLAIVFASVFVSGATSAQPLDPLPAAPPAPEARASAPSTTAPPSTAPEPPPPRERRSTSFLGIGPAYAGVLANSGSRSFDSYGVVLELGKNVPLSERVDLGLRLAWGLTAWDRFSEAAKAGYDIGAWTTEAYSDVYDWTRKHSGHPNTHGLRLFASFFAFITLELGYVVAGLAYLFALVAPSTYLEGDLTVNYNFSDDDPKLKRDAVIPYIKGGLGLMGFVHPDFGKLVGGLGPTVGAGVRIGGLVLGLSATWSPPPLHGEARDYRTHIVTGGLTVGSAY